MDTLAILTILVLALRGGYAIGCDLYDILTN